MKTTCIDEILKENCLVKMNINGVNYYPESLLIHELQEVEQQERERITNLINNAKTVKSEMEEMEGKEFSNGYQKALKDIISTNKE